ncbi:MAG TPA: sulfurtransferase TusA family protein [Roseiflexaceae bacterium]|jgi:TusA-related sulfurtransferase
MTDATLDAGAENCGRLIGLVVDAMAQLAPGQTLGVMTYDPSSQVDLAAWCRMTGHHLRSVTPVVDHLEFVIEKTQNAKEEMHGTRDDQQHAR